MGCGFRAVGLIFASSRVHAASLGPEQGRSWGPTRCAGLTARAGLVQTTLLVKGGQRHGSCPGCRISLGRCVHRPDGVGWDDFLPLCSSLQRGAMDLGPWEQPELGVLFLVPLFLLLPPSPSVLSLSPGTRGPRRTSVLCIPREGPCASPALILSLPSPSASGPCWTQAQARSWGSCGHPTTASNPVSSRPGSWLCLPLGVGVGSCRRRLPALPEVSASCCPVSSAGTVLQRPRAASTRPGRSPSPMV